MKCHLSSLPFLRREMDMGAPDARLAAPADFGWSRGSTMNGGPTSRWMVHRGELAV